MKKSSLALLVTIAIWTASPLALVRSSNLLPPQATPSAAVVLAALVLCMYFAIRDPEILYDGWHLARLKLTPAHGEDVVSSYLRLVSLSLLGFLAYPWLYVQAMQGATAAGRPSPDSLAGPVVVNIINYLWPCFAVASGWLLFRERPTRRSIAGLLLALSGALIATGSTTGTQGWILSHLYPSPTGASAVSTSTAPEFWFYVFAAAGALVWGLYTAMLPRCRFLTHSGKEVRPSSFYIALLVISVPFHIVLLITQWRNVLAFGYGATIPQVVYFLVYSTGSLSIAHCLFAYVRRGENVSLTSIAASTYLVFAGGTLLLFLSNGAVKAPPLAAGFGLMITGIYLAQDRAVFSPVSAFIVFFIIYYGLTAFFAPSRADLQSLAAENDFYAVYLGALTAVFAIFSSFSLTRAITAYAEREDSFRSAIGSLARLARTLSSHQSLHPRLRSLLQEVQNLYIESIEIHDLESRRLTERVESIDQHLDVIANDLNTRSLSAVDRNRALEATSHARTAVITWLARTFHRTSTYEWLVLGAFAAILALTGYRIQPQEATYRIGQAAFNAAVAVIIFAIADFEGGRPSQASRSFSTALRL